MDTGFNIVLLIQSDALPGNAQSTLQKKGHTTRVASSIKDAAELMDGLEHSLLFADCGQSPDFIVDTVKQIISNKTFQGRPLIIFGPDVDSFEGILDEHFDLSLTLNTPLKNKEILEALDFMVRHYNATVPEKEDQPTEGAPEEDKEGLSARETLIKELDSEIESIPDILFNQLENLNLVEREIGGAEFAFQVDASYADSHNLYPTDPNIKSAIQSVLDDAGKWGRLHLIRTCLVATKIAESLGLNEKTLELLKAASFLHAWSFAGNESELLKKDYIRSDTSIVKKDLCSRIKDSAMKTATTLADPELSELIATLGRYIGEEEPVGDDQFSVAACAIMAADISDRICYHSGHWNSRSAYHLMKRFKGGLYQDIHPQVWGCIIKFLSEAIVAKQSAWLLPKSVRENPDLIEKARANKEEPVEEHEVKVTLAVLKPGMKLSRPLFAFDGKKILPDDVTLDNDLIWRIWQLSAVRPLNSPVIVKSEKFKEFFEEEQ